MWVDLVSDGSSGRMVGTIMGPHGTPYRGGRFEMEVDVPKQYPFSTIKCRFLTKIWHPNVDHTTGQVEICWMSLLHTV